MVVQVFDVNTHQQTDLPLKITVEVDDMNDNAPTVDGSVQYKVAEKCKIGEKQNNQKVCKLLVLDDNIKRCNYM